MKQSISSKFDENSLNKFLDAKLNFDSVEKALSHARALQFTDQDCHMLVIERMKYMKEYQSLKDNMINSFTNSNIIKINDNWFGILCKKNELIVQPLKKDNIDSIKIDFVTNKAKSKDEYSKFVEENLNSDELNKYTNKVLRKADELLNQFFDCENTIKKNGIQYFLTAHCIKRWEERINNSDKKITVKNRDKIVDDLSKSFKNSIEVYSNVTENFETRFFLNFSDMIFFAITSDNVILTLWKNSFGFSDDKINKKATIMQLEHVKNMARSYKNMNDKHYVFVKQKKDNLEELNEKINDLNSQIEVLTTKRDEYREQHDNIKTEINSSRKLLKDALKKLKKEESLIFKQHRMINEEQET